MLRVIPLPDETIWDLKLRNNDPMVAFLLRWKLLELDIELNFNGPEKLLNCLEIEALVLTRNWPTC